MDALPPPPSPRSPIPIANIQKLYSTLTLQIRRLNAHIAHLSRLLKSTSHLDALLATTTYTLTFLTSLLPPPSPSPSPSSPPSTPKSPPRPTTTFSTHLTALTTLLSNLRITMRLFSLASIYTLLTTTLTTPPHDPYLRSIAYLQVGASAIFQVLENLAHLGDTGVLSVREGRRARWWLWCCRAWAVSIALEGGRLGRELVMRRRRRRRVEREKDGFATFADEEREEKEAKIARALGRERWWNEVLVNAAYAPMTLHWSFEGGLLPEGVIGALGMVAGGLGLREAWRSTA